jgi:cell wall-associated NlpC family hydrolase
MSTARWAFPCRITPVLRRLWVARLAASPTGDIIANAQHAAIYVGNGMVINSQLNGTRYDPIAWVFPSSYSIRRIF